MHIFSNISHVLVQAKIKAVCLGSALASGVYYYGWVSSEYPVTYNNVTVNAAALAFAIFLFILDFSKGSVVKAAIEKWNDRSYVLAGLGMLFGMALCIASFFAVDGLLMKLRVEQAGANTQAQKSWDRAEADYKAAKLELDSVSAVRTAAVVDQAIRAESVKILSVWRQSAQCTDITKLATAAACAPMLMLREEMAKANRKAVVAVNFAVAKSKLDGSTRPAAGDAQTEALAAATGHDANQLMLAICWIIGFAIEGVATVGPYLVSKTYKNAAPVALKVIETGEVPQATPLTIEAPIEHRVVAALRAASKALCNQDLAKAMGCAESESHRRVMACGNLVRKDRVGKFVMVSLR